MRNSKNTQQYHFHVLYQQDESGFYIARVPSLPGCHTQGKTIEQAEQRIKEAIGVYLESLEADGRHISHTEEKVFLGSVTI